MDLSSSRIRPPCQQPANSGTRFLLWAALGVFGAAVFLFRFDPSQSAVYPLCYFHRMTGLWCPGCGSLRALHQLLHGNLSAALHYNALLILSLPLLAWLGWRFSRGLITRQPVKFDVRPAWLWAGCAVLFCFGILRNLPFAHWAWLVP